MTRDPGEARRLRWLTGTVTQIRPEATDVATLVLEVPGWPGHLAGQHVDIRLTAPDGYVAQRSYSIASASGGAAIEITVELIADGEVSAFLLGEVRVGDALELRGPIGGYFTWEPGDGAPVLLVAGGSGVVPLMAMLRQRARAHDRTPVRLVYSSRSADAIIYRDELDAMVANGDGVEIVHTLTRGHPTGWTGQTRRIDAAMLNVPGFAPGDHPLAYVCGPTGLVEDVAATLVALGHDPTRVRTERFGPSGTLA